jgi:hypothetical protein
LTWALVDDEINDDETRLLENLLLSDDQARRTYIGCLQLHTDLTIHFRAPAAAAGAATKLPVLGFLNAEVPAVGIEFPSAEDAKS